MRLILGAKRPDTKNARAANFRVYLKPGCQANRGVWIVRGFRRTQRSIRALVGVGVGKDEAPATIESRRLLQTRTAIYAGR